MCRNNYIYFFILVAILAASCNKSKYLDALPDQRLVVPKTLEDFQAILDNDAVMNGSGPSGLIPAFTEESSDNYYFNDDILNSVDIFYKQVYTWSLGDNYGDIFKDWEAPYTAIFFSNVVLDGLSEVSVSAGQQAFYNNVKGSALFYRSYMFYNLAQVFTPPYDATSAGDQLGLPLRLSGDIGEGIRRSSLKDTYDRIVSDLKLANTLLPVEGKYKTRPSQWACTGLLARLYLTIGNIDSALYYSNQCLNISDTLMDYNNNPFINSNDFYTVRRLNPEVIFQSTLGQLNRILLAPGISFVDSTLYKSFSEDDLRKTIYFFDLNPGIAFRGSYDAETPFAGIAVDEVLLTRAECYARKGNTADALADLNRLLRYRFMQGTFTDYTAADGAEALMKVLAERRKELLMRGMRWTDIRRLNKEGANIIITRKVNGQTVQLPANDLRYTFLIPKNAISFHPDMPQNPR